MVVSVLVSAWFPVNDGLRQDCDDSMAVREVNARVLGKELELLRANGGRFDISLLLFADNITFDSNESLCKLAREFGRVCKIWKLRVNFGKSKVMVCSRYVNVGRIHVRLNDERLEEVDC